jgi:hypothetical protein
MTNPIAGGILRSPVIRKVFSKGFAFLINIDHLLLYVYHKRAGFMQLDSVLLWVHGYQESKWNFIPSSIEKDYLSFH